MIALETGQGTYPLTRIDRGGTATVYKSINPDTHIPLAVKVFPPNAQALAEHEAIIHGGLVHPNIVTFHGFETSKTGHPFITMQLTETSLHHRYIGTRPPISNALHHIEGVATGIDYMHGQGVVHRDIKPGNLLVIEGTRPSITVIADFGTANKGPEDLFIFNANRTFGTAEYKAPERLNIDRPPMPTPLADVYSLGVVAYELFTGKRPFSSSTPRETIIAVIQSRPPSFNEQLPLAMTHTLGELEPIVMQAMAKDPTQRPQSAGAFSNQLTEVFNAAQSQEAKNGVVIDLGRK